MYENFFSTILELEFLHLVKLKIFNKFNHEYCHKYKIIEKIIMNKELNTGKVNHW